MSHLHCPHCGLRLSVRAIYLRPDVCPRCLARHRRVVLLTTAAAGAPALHISSRRSPVTEHHTLHGDFDLAGVARFERTMQAALARSPRRLVLDLSGLRFLDSSGIHALARTRTEAAARGLELELRSAPPAVHRVAALTGSDWLLAEAPGTGSAAA
jgi:anti-sigma B factor antagonist